MGHDCLAQRNWTCGLAKVITLIGNGSEKWEAMIPSILVWQSPDRDDPLLLLGAWALAKDSTEALDEFT